MRVTVEDKNNYPFFKETKASHRFIVITQIEELIGLDWLAGQGADCPDDSGDDVFRGEGEAEAIAAQLRAVHGNRGLEFHDRYTRLLDEPLQAGVAVKGRHVSSRSLLAGPGREILNRGRLTAATLRERIVSIIPRPKRKHATEEPLRPWGVSFAVSRHK